MRKRRRQGSSTHSSWRAVLAEIEEAEDLEQVGQVCSELASEYAAKGQAAVGGEEELGTVCSVVHEDMAVEGGTSVRQPEWGGVEGAHAAEEMEAVAGARLGAEQEEWEDVDDVRAAIDAELARWSRTQMREGGQHAADVAAAMRTARESREGSQAALLVLASRPAGIHFMRDAITRFVAELKELHHRSLQDDTSSQIGPGIFAGVDEICRTRWAETTAFFQKRAVAAAFALTVGEIAGRSRAGPAVRRRVALSCASLSRVLEVSAREGGSFDCSSNTSQGSTVEPAFVAMRGAVYALRFLSASCDCFGATPKPQCEAFGFADGFSACGLAHDRRSDASTYSWSPVFDDALRADLDRAPSLPAFSRSVLFEWVRLRRQRAVLLTIREAGPSCMVSECGLRSDQARTGGGQPPSLEPPSLSSLGHAAIPAELHRAHPRHMHGSLVEPWPIPRAPAHLSVQEFWAQYSARRIPCILDIGSAGPPSTWNLEYLRQILSSHSVDLQCRVAGSSSWAGLERAKLSGNTTGSGLINSLDDLAVPLDPAVRPENLLQRDARSSILDACSEAVDDHTPDAFFSKSPETAQGQPATVSGVLEAPYLFDWSLPQHCPELAAQVVISRFFSTDLLQHAPPGSLYRESWPSLFIGPRGSRCGLHIDASALHFYMVLIEGAKRWTLFPPASAATLAPSYIGGHDAAFGSQVHPGPGGHHGAWARLPRWEATLRAGECLFVPCGIAHVVTNLSHTAAISANYVDSTNLDAVLDELSVRALRDPRANALRQELQKVCCIHKCSNECTCTSHGKACQCHNLAPFCGESMTCEAVDLTWKQFKSPFSRERESFGEKMNNE